LNGLRAGKWAFRIAGIVVELLILLVIAGPIAGAVTPQVGPQHYGLGIELNAIQPQLNQVFQGSDVAGTHVISVPAFNNWPISGVASLSLALVDNNQTIYTTQPSSVHLAPYQSGSINVTLVFSPSLVTQMQGQRIGIGGTMTESEGDFWTISVNLSGE
jgi:hypothetical protein